MSGQALFAPFLFLTLAFACQGRAVSSPPPVATGGPESSASVTPEERKQRADTLSISFERQGLNLWADHLTPEPDELKWAEIPWLSSLHEGIVAADASDRPLLLWVMNGHPLGCT